MEIKHWSWKVIENEVLQTRFALSVNENHKKRKLMSRKLDPLHLFL